MDDVKRFNLKPVLEVWSVSSEGNSYVGKPRQTIVGSKKQGKKDIPVMGLVGQKCPNVSIPGLDADFCKCEQCTDSGKLGGIWYVNRKAQLSILESKRAVGSASDSLKGDEDKKGTFGKRKAS